MVQSLHTFTTCPLDRNMLYDGMWVQESIKAWLHIAAALAVCSLDNKWVAYVCVGEQLKYFLLTGAPFLSYLYPASFRLLQKRIKTSSLGQVLQKLCSHEHLYDRNFYRIVRPVNGTYFRQFKPDHFGRNRLSADGPVK